MHIFSGGCLLIFDDETYFLEREYNECYEYMPEISIKFIFSNELSWAIFRLEFVSVNDTGHR